MAKEIERKFLVCKDHYKQYTQGMLYKQGYLNNDPERTVRIRVIHQDAYITIKGKTVGATRAEYEYPIPLYDANEMLATMCKGTVIEKHRYKVAYEGHIWEIDEFHGENEGLVIAEIELGSEDESFIKPEWIGTEVTNDMRYQNSNLTVNPYKNW